ncbi:hypothetical protein GA0061101_106121 [Rhizobium lusitanum]|uniref:Uncharacterized protein n=2 Tax=Rhizobium lusitanum TaxID=293958 RepID=A0A1C3VRY3_9HYPH|nr:hypothetical protein GA0061101_106121 [Rhizobium lusitanum]
MQHVMDIAQNGNKPARIPSENSPDKTAGLWLDERIAKSKFGVVSEVIDLTPAMARVMLARNPGNRKLSSIIVENYARDMANGAWAFNGEPIIISNDGKLNDGQHRCEAVLASNTAIRVVLIIGPDRESRLTVDQGKTRMTGDYLGMNGHVDSVALAAAAKFVWQHVNHSFITQTQAFRPTKMEVLSFVEDHPSVAESLAAIPSKGSDAVGGRAILAFAHWTFTRVSGKPEAVSMFMDALIKGSNLVPRSPILYARNRLMSERGRLKPNEKAELIIRAWNASRRGDKVSNLPIKGGALPTVER